MNRFMPTTFFSLRGNVCLELLMSTYQTTCVITVKSNLNEAIPLYTYN